MVKLIETLSVLVLLALAAIGSVSSDTIATSIVAKLLGRVHQDNQIVAPELLRGCLTQMYLWARDQTAREIHTFLQLGSMTKQDLIESPYDEHLKTDLRFFVSKFLGLVGETKVPSLFGDTVEAVNFRDVNETCARVNSWIADRTNNEVTQVAYNFHKGTQILVVGASYFNKLWKLSFNPSETKTMKFYGQSLNGGSEVTQVPMMFRTGSFKKKYIPELKADIVELPFSNGLVTFKIILPRLFTSLGMVVKRLGDLDTNELTIGTKQYIKLMMPKLKYKFSIGLRSALMEHGVIKLFTNADLGDLTQFGGPVRIQDIMQTVSVNINEKGSTIVGTQKSKPKKPKKKKAIPFNVTRPFLFLVMTEDKIYFAGRVNIIHNK